MKMAKLIKNDLRISMDVNLKNLIRLIHEEQKSIAEYESRLFNIIMNRGTSWYFDKANQEEAAELDEEENGIEDAYRHTVEFIYNAVLTILELLSLNEKRTSLIQNIEKIRANEGGKFKIEFLPQWDSFDCPSLSVLNTEVKILSALLNEIDKQAKAKEEKDLLKDEVQRRLIEQLKQTGFYVSSLQADPSKENDIQKVMNAVLEGSFGADFRKKPSISQPFKNFEADGGLKSIETAIEFKFIDSDTELKTSTDGIYTDFTGYSESKDWNKFISVFYMTDNFRSHKTIEEDVISKTHGRWRVIVIIGNGARKKKATATKKATQLKK